MPDLKRAELLEGVVHMPSPVSHTHSVFLALLTGWLMDYRIGTPGCEAGSAGTWLMTPNTIPQPDLTLRWLPEHGFQSQIVNGYPAGAPELAVEITHSSSARDLGPKGNLYLTYGVREYVVVLTRKSEVVWREAASGRYRKLPMGDDGIIRSRVFPGLWLDVQALWRGAALEVRKTLELGLASRPE